MSISDQKLITTAFADNASTDYRYEITDTNQTDLPNKATFQQGFSPITMQDINAGGLPPLGQDFNGILHHLSKAIQYLQSGEFTEYNGEFANAIGGYRAGAIVKGSDGLLYRCNQDNNTSDPIDLNGWGVLFNSSTDSDSETAAATPKAVKEAYNLAKEANDRDYEFNGGTVIGDTNFTGKLQQAGNDVITTDNIVNYQNGIGIDQTWQDMKESRQLGVTYKNTTGKPIFLHVCVTNNSDGGRGMASLSINIKDPKKNDGGVSLYNITGGLDKGWQTKGVGMDVIVPDNHEYTVTSSDSSLKDWAELR